MSKPALASKETVLTIVGQLSEISEQLRARVERGDWKRCGRAAKSSLALRWSKENE